MAFGVLDKMMFTRDDFNVVNKYNNKIKHFFEYRERINVISDNIQIQFLIGQPAQIFKKVGKDIGGIISSSNTMQNYCKKLFERSELWKIMNAEKQKFIEQETTNIKLYNKLLNKPNLDDLTEEQQNLLYPQSVKIMRVDLSETTKEIETLNVVLAANSKKIKAKEEEKNSWLTRSNKKNKLTEELAELIKFKTMTVNDLEAWKLYYGIYERMNAKVDNILNDIKNVEPKDFYKKLVVLYTKIDLYKGFNEKIKELHKNVGYLANQKEPNPAALFRNEANFKKFKEIIVLRQVFISKYLEILEINESELKANLTEKNMEEESNSWSTTIFSTSTDAQSSDSGSSSDFGESSLTLTQSHPHTSGSTSTSDSTKVF
ncbi:unnamed protein product [Meloidogyne enterolobii]|uniref:Uncharacterized protein n=1 Tax=Meloidogyne enterolobii TaxID=390850 RepID=A0ACB1AKX8_MELEN